MKEATRIEYAPTPPEVLRCRVRHHPPHLDHHNAGRAHVSDHETWQVIPEGRRHKVFGRHRRSPPRALHFITTSRLEDPLCCVLEWRGVSVPESKLHTLIRYGAPALSGGAPAPAQLRPRDDTRCSEQTPWMAAV